MSIALFIPETAEEEDNDIGMVDVLYPHRLRSDGSASGVDDGNKPKKTKLGLVGA